MKRNTQPKKKPNKYSNMRLRVPEAKKQQPSQFGGQNVVQSIIDMKAERKKAPKVENNPFHEHVQQTMNAIDAIPAKRFSIDETVLLDRTEEQEEQDGLFENRGLKDIMFYQQDSEIPMRKGCCWKCCHELQISLFWEEKMLLIVEYLQMLGLILTIFWEIWPSKLRSEAGWLMLLNIDIITYDLGLHQILTNRSYVFRYNIAWCAGLVLLGFFFFLLKLTGCIRHLNTRAPHCCVRMFSYALQILILPVLLNTIPYAPFTFSTSRVDIVKYEWYSQEQIVIVVISCIVITVFLVAQILMCFHIRKYAIYYNNEKHEQYLKQKELEYTLAISELWRFKHFYLFSSYRRNLGRAYHRNIKWAYWLVLVLIHAFMGQQSLINYKPLAIFSTILLWILYTTFRPPYRNMSTFIIQQIILFILSINVFFAFSRAIDVKSALLIDENIAYVMYTLNGVAVFFLLFFLILFFWMRWHWPLNRQYILDNVKKYMRYVAQFKQARLLIQRIHINEGDFLKNEADLEYAMQQYERLYEQIKDDYEHILNSLALELLEELKLAKHEMTLARKLNDGRVPPSVDEQLNDIVESRNRVLE